MISNQHPTNKPPSREKSSSIQQRESLIKATKQAIEDKAIKLDEEMNKTLSKETPEKAGMANDKDTTPNRRRSYACSSIDEVAQAFELDVHDGELTEKSPPRGRAYAISGKEEFHRAFPDSPEKE